MVSIIIVTWNNEDIILGCIESIYQYEKDVEVIVVDNASTDKTVEILQSIHNTPVRVISLKENVGFAQANNIGVTYAKSEDILFLNPDTLFLQKNLKKIFNYLTDSIGIVSCKFLNADKTMQPSCFNFDTPLNILLEQFMIGKIFPECLKRKVVPYLSNHESDMLVDWTVGAFIAMKKTTFLSVGGFSECYFLYSEDMDLCYKVNKIDKKTQFVASYEIIHLGGKSEQKDSGSTKQIKLLESKKIYAQKYHLDGNIKMLKWSYRIKYSLVYVLTLLTLKKSQKISAKMSKYKDSKNYLSKI